MALLGICIREIHSSKSDLLTTKTPNAFEKQYTVAFALKKNMKKEVALGTWPLLLDWISYLISF
jgi:hypothetical protein